MKTRAFHRPLVFGSLLLLLGPLDARAAVTANDLFQDGLAAAEEERWDEAVKAFEKSLELQDHSLTLYLLSVCHSKRLEAEKAKEYALRALRGKPPLSAQYDQGARDLLEWSAVRLLAPVRLRVRYEMEADDPVSKDTLSRAAEEEASRDYEAELRNELKPYVDFERIELELHLVEASDPCAGPSTPEAINRCLEAVFLEKDDHLPPPPDYEPPSEGDSGVPPP